MTASSVSGYVLRAPVTAFDAGQPVSSFRAWENRQNILHLTDEFSQHRINWVSRDESGHGIESADGDTPIWSYTYPHTWLAPNKPANIDVQVMGHHCFVRARLVKWDAPPLLSGIINGNLADSVFDEILDVSSSSPTSADFLHINGASSISVFDTAWMKPSGGGQQGADGVTRKPAVCLMRLELQVLSETASRVFGVLLRECA